MSEHIDGAAERLAALLQAAHNGEDVDPAEVATVRAAIELEQLREAGERERREAAEQAELQARHEKFAAGLDKALRQSEAQLRSRYSEAYKLLVEVLDEVQAHNELAARAAEQLGVEVERDKYTNRLNIGGAVHQFWSPSVWMINFLRSVNAKHRIGKGTPSRYELPPAVNGAPRP